MQQLSSVTVCVAFTESIEGTNNEGTVEVEAPIEAFTADVKSRDEEITSSFSGSKSDHKRVSADNEIPETIDR